MSNRLVDRGAPLKGLLRTTRDVRQDPSTLRDTENFRYRDGRAQRRDGFGFWGGVETRIQGQQLTKQTPAIAQSERTGVVPSLFGQFDGTPNSYALIRGHADFSPLSTRDWTVELLLTVGEQERLVTSPHVRLTTGTFGGALQVNVRNAAGVFVYDQTLLASYCDFDDGTGTQNLRPPTLPTLPAAANTAHSDTLALTALAIGFNSTELFATCTLLDDVTRVYFPYKVNLTHGITYTPGTVYHVAVRYTNSTRVLELIIDGSAATGGSGAATYTLLADEVFAGEDDEINTKSLPLPRDIVLLNECTARGAYASTCKLSHIANACTRFTQDRRGEISGAFNLGPPVVAYCSPPRGTAIAELRIWHEARSNVNLAANDKLELASPFSANLSGYWRLNDGGGILVEQIAERHGSVHNTYPQYIADKGLLHSQGIKFADNQYLTAQLSEDAYAQDVYNYLKDCMRGVLADSVFASGTPQSQTDFTVQVQIRTPYRVQEELCFGLSDSVISPLAYPQAVEWTTGEIREAPGDGSALGTTFRVDTYDLKDGNATPSRIVDDLGNLTRSAVDVSMFHPAYDQTIWSIEGKEKRDGTEITNQTDNRSIPLARGVLDPTMAPCFEFFADGSDGAVARHGRYLRVQGSALTPNTVYTLTFRKRSLFSDGSTAAPIIIGFALEIWVDGAQDVSQEYIIDLVTGGPAITDAALMPRAVEHRLAYDINIGASYVHDYFDMSQTAPIDSGAAPLDYAHPVMWGMLRNRPYQDQPGFFTMGFFRMWATSHLTDEEIKQTYNTTMVPECLDSTLILNYEIDQITAGTLVNKARTGLAMQLGFKGWGIPNGDELFTTNTLTYDPHVWSHQDCLGYNRHASDFLPATATHAECNLLGLYSATVARTFGLMAVFGDSPMFDSSLLGTLSDVYCPLHGLLNEFAAGQKWDTTVIADRMMMTATGALPKTFDGKCLTSLGFPRYHGPALLAATQALAGSLTASSFFGVRVEWFAENVNIREASSLAIVKTGAAANQEILIRFNQQHPDPRMTSYRIYRTVAQPSYAEALVSPLFLIPFDDANLSGGALENKFSNVEFLRAADADLLPIVMDLTETDPPVGAVSASLDGRLWIAGDPLIPDILHFSDAGNPQRFDIVVNNLVLEESSGEIVNSLFPIFGSLFVGKPTSIQRVDPSGNGQFNVVKIVGVGPISAQAIESIVMPDDGRTVLAFWSKFGPYLFDGQREEYLGYPIELESQSGKPYDWLDAESVFLLHDPSERELIFFYKSVTSGTAADRHDKAVVFNYRTRSWYAYGQAVASYALSSGFASSSTVAAIGAGATTTGAVPLTPTQAHKLIVGGPNGHLYEWGTASRDGERTDVSINPSTVVSWSTPTLTLTGTVFTASDVVRGSWVTVYRPSTKAYFSLPAITNGASTLELDLSYAAVGFAPAASDLVYVGQPPASLELPWDDLDSPMLDKSVPNTMVWTSGAFEYALLRDWTTTDPGSWTTVADNAGKRKKLQNAENLCEVVKMYLHSTALGAQFNQFGHLKDDKMTAGKIQ